MSVTHVRINQQDRRLGRHQVHDSRSKEYAAEVPRSAAPLRTVQHRRYDPTPEPEQQFGCCSTVSEVMMANTSGNRVKGEVLTMDDALRMYSRATQLDPFLGTFPPSDTGSSGLAAAKAAVEFGVSTRYEWYFGVPAFLRGLQEHPISVGGYWYWDMFNATKDNPVVRPTGGEAGGHQWVASGYNVDTGLIAGECWWGPKFARNGRFYITVPDFALILENGGDAHFSHRKMTA